MKILFQYAMGELTHDILIAWERADPLRVTKIAPGTYTVSYDDHHKFKVRSLAVIPGLSYTTQFSDDGLTLLLRPKTSGVAKPTSSCRSITGKRQAAVHRANDRLETKAVKTVPKIKTSTKITLKSRTCTNNCTQRLISR